MKASKNKKGQEGGKKSCLHKAPKKPQYYCGHGYSFLRD